jgi:hypothetical protein
VLIRSRSRKKRGEGRRRKRLAGREKLPRGMRAKLWRLALA